VTRRPESHAIGEDFAWADGVCSRAIDLIAELSDFDADFVSQLAPRLDRYRERTLFSEKQLEVLRRIERRLGELE